ncbi:TPA: hypothetical protein ACX6MH_001468 [Photobacterium damselae]
MDDSTAHLTWNGFVKIIPGANYTITAENGSMDLKDGTLNLNANGTFTSSAIILEGHKYTKDASGVMTIGDLADADWNLDSVKMDWGTDNTPAASEISNTIVVKDQISGAELSKGGIPIHANKISLTVENTAVPTTAIANLGAEAFVNATVVASFLAEA